ncbi:MAG: DUF3179 domain-containing protein [Alphaproteobacteria bacterium]|nr:DUF3179 domain-containing protein [Alphaproteobacteria bacterium]
MEQDFRTETPRPRPAKGRRGAALAVAAVLALPAAAGANPMFWAGEWPNTDFSRHSVDLAEIMSGGPPKDGIPSIDDPRFVPVSEVTDLTDTEPVIGVTVNGEARAYPLGIITRHEIVNDTIGGVPVTVTYCPLCNSSIVFDRRVDGQVLDFGTTGKLRNSDLVMYDRQTESWWQQFSGQAIVGKMTGKTLKMLPSRQESFARFRARAPNGKVLVSNQPFRRYGINPYVRYDSAPFPFLFRGDLPEGIAPMVRVVAVGGEAWSLPLLRKKGTIVRGDLVLSWEAGQNSALDTRVIRRGRDVGNVVVQRRDGNGFEDVVHDVTFAFVFHAFHPEGTIHTE